jgi:aspartokinase-like uncharacterized kinase
MARRRPLTIVKLGGSAAFSPRLREWLDVLARSGGHAVLVPGGGPFADAVRSAQDKIGFDDRAAHRMALLAMEQYACGLVSLNRRLVPADSLAALRRALLRHHTPVWLASRMALADPDIPWSWEVTSDSLAIWLAGRLAAERTLLVKQVVTTEAAVPAPLLAAQGIIDAGCVDFMRAARCDVYILGPQDCAMLERSLLDGRAIGTRVLPAPDERCLPQTCRFERFV